MRERQGFSLMEMMIVLLIMAIIAAATAPIVSKKMTKSASGTSATPWVFTGEGKNIAYNMGGLSNATAIIGAAKVPEGTNARLYIDCGDNTAQIALGSGDTAANILADPVGNRVAIYSAESNLSVSRDSVAIGMGQGSLGTAGVVSIGSKSSASDTYNTAIGYSANASGQYSTAIGASTKASSTYSTAIGNESEVTGEFSLASGARAKAAKGCVAVGAKAQATGSQSIAIGGGSPTGNGPVSTHTNSIAIGTLAKVTNVDSIAIGNQATVSGDNSVAIGSLPSAAANLAIAVGQKAQASGFNFIAIGSGSNADYPRATKRGAVAIGYNAFATNEQSYAIGNNAKTTANNQIVLGSRDYTVYIPENLIVMGTTMLGGTPGSLTHIREEHSNHNILTVYGVSDSTMRSNDKHYSGVTIGGITFTRYSSDRRLKNIGKKYTAGLDELKKLDFYHYTFKKDKNKIPHVGVIAQDLQKVFPDAVTKAEDGYLQIRFEDMFYAVINAVKELDNKLSSIIAKNNEQDKIIKAQQQTIGELEKRLAKLEKEKS